MSDYNNCETCRTRAKYGLGGVCYSCSDVEATPSQIEKEEKELERIKSLKERHRRLSNHLCMDCEKKLDNKRYRLCDSCLDKKEYSSLMHKKRNLSLLKKEKDEFLRSLSADELLDYVKKNVLGDIDE